MPYCAKTRPRLVLCCAKTRPCFVCKAVEFGQRLAFHLKLHLRVLLKHLRIALPEQLRDPLVRNAAGAEPGRIRRTKVVNAKVWHGRYLERESAAHGAGDKRAGFSHDNEGVNIASKLDGWQKAGDQRLWKLIVSPEFGERVDLIRLTRDLMHGMAEDLATELEWIAVEHYNTEHPHVHIALRGLREDGTALRMSREYVQKGIREITEHLCTAQLGYRTQLDAAEAERREITEKRFTSIDRQLMKSAREISFTDGQQYFAIGTLGVRDQHKFARLTVLQRMGLAESTGAGTWLIRRDFEQVLRAMQRAADRQRTLAAHGALMSDERLPIEVLDFSQRNTVEGRVLVHDQEERSQRKYLILESTGAKVYFVDYTPEMEQAHSRGEMRVNSFVRLETSAASGTMTMDLQDLGDAESLLSNHSYFANAARALLNREILPREYGWGGWLGRYQAALCKAVREILGRKEQQTIRARERGRHYSLGR